MSHQNSNMSSNNNNNFTTMRRNGNQSVLRLSLLLIVFSPFSRAINFDFLSSAASAVTSQTTAEAAAVPPPPPSQVLIATSSEEALSFTNNMAFQYDTALPHSHHRSLGSASSLNCTCPDGIYYKANITMSTYTTAECSWVEMDWIALRIHHHWDQYSAYNKVLGPIDIIQSPTVCSQAPSRRLLQEDGGYGEEEGTYVFGGGGEDADARRKLRFNYAPYNLAGNCRYCPRDSKDDRRLSTGGGGGGVRGAATATTTDGSRRHLSAGDDGLIKIKIMTDKYPEEVSYNIEDKDGVKVVTHSKFDEKDAYHEQEWVLIQDATYTLNLLDEYGDGWCCAYGNGHALIIDPITDTILHNITGAFGGSSSTTFKVPTNNQTQSRSNAELILTDLEPYLSTYISFYIQQEFHQNITSCLNQTNPTVWVDLVETDLAGSLDPCS